MSRVHPEIFQRSEGPPKVKFVLMVDNVAVWRKLEMMPFPAIKNTAIDTKFDEELVFKKTL